MKEFDETGEHVEIEAWDTSKRLPPEVISALPRLEGIAAIVESGA